MMIYLGHICSFRNLFGELTNFCEKASYRFILFIINLVIMILISSY